MPYQICTLHHPNDENYLKQFESVLTPLKHKNFINTWYPNSIRPGQIIDDEVHKNLRKADVIIVFCSPDLFSFNRYYKYLQFAVNLQKNENKLIVPILVRHCFWEESIIANFPPLLPKNQEPIKNQKDLDGAFKEVIEQLLKIILGLKTILFEAIPLQETIPVTSQLLKAQKNLLKKHKKHTKLLFALEYASSPTFLQNLIDKDFIQLIYELRILEEEEDGWRVNFTLSERLKKDFKIKKEQLRQLADKAMLLFREERYEPQDLFNIAALLFKLHKPVKQDNKEKEIIEVFSKIKFRKTQNPLAVSRLLNSFVLNIDNFKVDIIDRVIGTNNFISGLITLGKYDYAFQYLESILPLSEQNLGKEHRATGKIYELFGHVYFHLGKHKEAIEAYLKAIAICEKQEKVDFTHLAALYQNSARPYYRLRNLKESQKRYDMALDICHKYLGADEESQKLKAKINSNMGVVHEGMYNYLEAERSHNRAIDIKKELWGENHPSVTMSYHNLGNLYQKMGDYNGALRQTQKALKIREIKLGKTHPYTIKTRSNLITIYTKLHELEKAQTLAEELLEVFGTGSRNANYFSTLEALGFIYMRQGKLDKALEKFDLSQKERLKDYKETQKLFIQTQHDRYVGNVLYYKKKYKAALEKYEGIFEVYIQKRGAEHPDIARLYFLKGRALVKIGAEEEALKNLDKALEIRRKQKIETHPEIALIYEKMAELFRSKEIYLKAISYNEKALYIYRYNQNSKKTAQTLAFLIDAYFQSEDLENPKLRDYLMQLCQIQDKVVYQWAIDVLRKLKSFENKSIDVILQIGNYQSIVYDLLKEFRQVMIQPI